MIAGCLTLALVAGLGSALRSTGPATPSRSAPMVPAAYRRVPGGTRLQLVQSIADSSAWNWRAAGVSYVIGFHPEACCHWGVYDSRSGTIYVGPTAFGSVDRLRYVVLHETAHAWQYRAGPAQAVMGDFARWGYRGANGLEAGADCIATLWGAARSQGHYWHCPDRAVAVAASELGRP